MGIDQYNQHYDNLGKYPRKTLLERLGATGASKMYVDKLDGASVHCGYIIQGLWIKLYKLEPIEK